MKAALTGGIACGKSTFAKFLSELGIRVLDADDVVHELEAPGGEAVPAIVARFGRSVLAPDGGIDRPKLASLVFPLRGQSPSPHGGQSPYQERGQSPQRGQTPHGGQSPIPPWGQSPFGGQTPKDALEGIIFPLVRKRLLSFLNGDRSHDRDKPHLGDRPVGGDRPHGGDRPISLAIIPLLFESHFDSDYDTIIAIASPEEVQIDRMMRTRGYSRAQAEARLAAQMPVAEKVARAHFVVVNDSTPERLRKEAVRLAAWLEERAKHEQ